MPMGDADDDYGKPTRNFLYGPDKTKKTWWALRAAEAGFNVVILDGDGGSSIKNQLPVEARKKILVVDVTNTIDRAVFARFGATFFKGAPFLWDEQAKTSHLLNFKRKPEHSYVQFEPTKLGMNDVLILDSWTRLASSTMMEWASETSNDLTAIEREGDQLALMNYQSRYLNFVLEKIGGLSCHVIVIGHETVYEKFEDKQVDGRKKRVMVDQRTQPFSSTGPHAKKIGAHFSNVLRFRKESDIAFRIDAGGDKQTMGGARQLAPKVYKWEDISPNTIFAAVGSKPTGEACRGAVWIAPGENSPVVATQTTQANTPSVESVSTPKVLSAGNSLADRLKLKPVQPR